MSFFTKFAQGSAAQLGGREKFVLPYRNRLRLEVDHSNLGLSADIENFPVRINLGTSAGRNSFNASAVFTHLDYLDQISDATALTAISYARKIKITDVDFNNLYVEVASWSQIDATAELWVNVSKVNYNKKTTLYLYYDYNAEDNNRIGVSGSTVAQNVWDSDYSLVMHFGDPDEDGNYQDSANGRVGTPTAGIVQEYDPVYGVNITGGATDFINMSDPSGLYNDYLMFEMIFKIDDIDANSYSHFFTATGGTASEHMNLNKRNDHASPDFDNVFGFLWDSGPGNTSYKYATKNSLSSNTWVYGVLSQDFNDANTADGAIIKIDNIEVSYQTNTDNSYPNDFSNSVNIAGNGANGLVNSNLSEFRISTVARSDDWLKLTKKTLEDDMVNYSFDSVPHLEGFRFRQKFEINKSRIDEDLTDFPVAVHLSSGNSIFSRLGVSDSKKVAFQDENGNQCYAEIENFDQANSRAVYHVKIPTVHSNRNTPFYMYYDSSAPDNNTYIGNTGEVAAQNVWDSNFVQVLHMNQDPSGGNPGDIIDSVGNHTTLDPVGFESGDLQDGLGAAKALNFDSGEYIQSLTDISTFNFGSAGGITQECLFKPDSVTSVSIICGWGYNTGVTNDDRSLRIFHSASTIRIGFRTSTGTEQAPNNPISNGNWYHVVGVRPTSDLIPIGYINGGVVANQGGSAADFNYTNHDQQYVGRDSDYSSFQYDGQIGEIRLSNTDRSAAWIKATYHSLFNTLLRKNQEEVAWLDGFRYRKEFIIDHRKIDSNLTDFPLTIHLNDTAGIADEDVTDFFDRLKDNRVISLSGYDFTGVDGDSFDRNLWVQPAAHSGTAWEIQNNKGYVSIGEGESPTEQLLFTIQGDFDIQYEFDSLSIPTITGQLKLIVTDKASGADNSALVFAERGSLGSRWVASIKTGGGAFSEAGSASRTNNFGGLRFVRSGSDITFYYKDGGGSWTSLSTDAFTSSELYITIQASTSGTSSSLTTNIDNFIINSAGSLVFRSEYLDELANVKRKRIAITTSDGETQCYVEIENFDSANNQATLYTKIPSISASQDTKIYLYFDSIADDNTTYVGDTGDVAAQNVWDSNFEGVYHLNSTIIPDSTVNGRDGTNHGSSIGADGYLSFDGSTDYVTLPDSIENFLLSKTDHTFEMVVSIDPSDSVAFLMNAGGRDNDEVRLLDSTEVLFTWDDDPTNYNNIISQSYKDDNYHHFCYTIDSNNSTVFVDYADSNTESISSAGNLSSTANVVGIGVRIDADGTSPPSSELQSWLQGSIKEVRISSTKRSNAWIRATYIALFDRIFRYIGYTKTR